MKRVATGLLLAILLSLSLGAQTSASKTIQSVVNNPTMVITPPAEQPVTTPTTTVSGSSKPNSTLNIINNGRLVARIQTNDDGTFLVPIPLDIGNNKIFVEPAVTRGQVSKPITIVRQPTWWHSWESFAKLAAIPGLAVILLGLAVKIKTMRAKR